MAVSIELRLRLEQQSTRGIRLLTKTRFARCCLSSYTRNQLHALGPPIKTWS